MFTQEIRRKILTQHIAILGKTGSGKSYTAKGFIEALLRDKQRVCVIDPTGAYWGLRSDKLGTGPGFPITVFGGDHGDLPIERHHGQSIAEIIATTDTSAIIDTQAMTVGERTQFFTDFAETLLRKNIGTLHLVVDEGHLFAPQGRVSDPQSGKMLHAANNLVSLGRGRGLRIILISQRPAKLHKDSLTQVETLIAMRLIAPQDRGAVENWIGEWADPKQGAELLKSLPSLPTGEGWVWAPELDILLRTKFPQISTYDSSRAPDGSSTSVVLASIDLPTIESRLASVADELKANDPKLLRARINELELELEGACESTGKAALSEDDIRAAEDRGYQRGQQQGFQGAVQEFRAFYAEIDRALAAFERTMPDLSATDHAITRRLALAQPVPATFFLNEQHELPRPAAPSIPVEKQVVRNQSNVKTVSERYQNNGTLPEGERIILTAAAQYVNGVTREQISILAGYKRSSRDTYISRLAGKNLVRVNGGIIEATVAGIAALGSGFEPLPTGRKLREHWLEKLPAGERVIFEALIKAGGREVTRDSLSEATGYKRSSRDTYISRLTARQLVIPGAAGMVRASDQLF